MKQLYGKGLGIEEWAIVNPYVQMAMKDGILVGIYRKGQKIDLNIAKEIVSLRLFLTGEKPVPGLIYCEGGVSINKPARDFLSSIEGIKGLSAAAMVLSSTFDVFIGNFFINVNKTTIPARIFSNTDSAILWLKKYL